MKNAFTLIELSKIVSKGKRKAFTLIELLVVITIIIVLLALLTPALDQALYQAKLASCGAQLNGVGSGALRYTLDHRRAYPARPAMDQDNGNYMPTAISLPFGAHNRHSTEGYLDMRPVLEPYINLDALQCAPAVQDIDIPGSQPDTMIFSSYALFFGWRFKPAEGNAAQPVAAVDSTGMFRMGQPLGYKGYRYHALGGDWFSVLIAFGASIDSAHNDSGGKLSHFQRQDELWTALPTDIRATVSFHQGPTSLNPDTFDINFVMDDGSVRRFNDVSWRNVNRREDERFGIVPWAHGWEAFPDTAGQGSWTAVPR